MKHRLGSLGAWPRVLAVALSLAACDSEGTSGVSQDVAETDAPGLGGDTADGADTAVETEAPDTREPDDSAPPIDTALPDTSPADTAEPPDTSEPVDTSEPADTTAPPDTAAPPDTTGDGSAELCTAACIEVEPGLPGVAITLEDLATSAPVLRGLVGDAAPLGRFELTAVDVYPKGAVPGFVTMSVTDGGGTNGAAEVESDAWGVHLDLDLALSLSAFGQGFNQAAQQELAGGGCYVLDASVLASDLSHCATGWPDNVAVPDEAEFEFDDASGTLKLKLTLSKDFLLSLVPAEYAGLANLVISGPLNLVLTLESAGPL